MSDAEYEGTIAFPRGEQRREFDVWRQKMRQRAYRRLKERYPDDFAKLLMEEQLADWDNRPKIFPKPEVEWTA